MTNPINTLVDDFVAKLQGVIRTQALEHIQTTLGLPTTAKPATKATHTKAAPVQTAKLSRARQIQGKYLGLLRTATGNRRARAKAIAGKSGVAAAIKFLAN
jgi:hypothetical protein